MAIYRDAYNWGELSTEERYWFARLWLEAYYYNQSNGGFWELEEISDLDLTPEWETPEFGKLSRQMRESAMWEFLICCCYSNRKAEGAILESVPNAIIDCFKVLVETEIEFADWSSEDRNNVFTRYQVLAINTCRKLMPPDSEEGLYELIGVKEKLIVIGEIEGLEEIIDDDLAPMLEAVLRLKTEDVSRTDKDNDSVLLPDDKMQNIMLVEDFFNEISLEDLKRSPHYCDLWKAIMDYHPITPEEVFELDTQDSPQFSSSTFWFNIFSKLETLFTAANPERVLVGEADTGANAPHGDFSFGADTPDFAKELLGIAPNYYDNRELIEKLSNNIGNEYWQLLICCLTRSPVPKYEKLKPHKYEQENIFARLNKLKDKQLKIIAENLYTCEYGLDRKNLKSLSKIKIKP